MKSILAAMNAKFAHTNIAIRSLKKASLSPAGITIKEYTINMRPSDILEDLFDEKIRLYGFSTYIWNIDIILKTAAALKQLNPASVIFLGGPEASFEYEELIKNHPFIDYIITGEGEKAFPEFLKFQNGDIKLSDVPSLVFREGGDIRRNPDADALDLNKLPFLYDDINGLKNRVLYYESSRGCPYGCSFCLSSTTKGVRYKDIDTVKKDIDRFIEGGAMKVKFVDRTFNADIKRAKENFSHIIKKGGNTGFHFEVSAELLDDETLDILEKAPKGLIQVEAGVQSVNARTLAAINRKDAFNKIKRNMIKLNKAGNIHTHIDIIAGLPYESYEQFKTTFDSAFMLKADNLQLGFLKLLKGSKLRNEAEKHGIKYTPYAPYTVLETSDISFGELNRLKKIEAVLQKSYNSGLLKYTVIYLAQIKGSVFLVLEGLADIIFSEKQGEIAWTKLPQMVYNYACLFAEKSVLKDIMRFDLCNGKSRIPLPDFLWDKASGQKEKEFFKGDYRKYLDVNKAYVKDYRVIVSGTDMEEFISAGRIIKKHAVIVFDYINCGVKFYNNK